MLSKEGLHLHCPLWMRELCEQSTSRQQSDAQQMDAALPYSDCPDTRFIHTLIEPLPGLARLVSGDDWCRFIADELLPAVERQTSSFPAESEVRSILINGMTRWFVMSAITKGLLDSDRRGGAEFELARYLDYWLGYEALDACIIDAKGTRVAAGEYRRNRRVWARRPEPLWWQWVSRVLQLDSRCLELRSAYFDAWHRIAPSQSVPEFPTRVWLALRRHASMVDLICARQPHLMAIAEPVLLMTDTSGESADPMGWLRSGYCQLEVSDRQWCRLARWQDDALLGFVVLGRGAFLADTRLDWTWAPALTSLLLVEDFQPELSGMPAGMLEAAFDQIMWMDRFGLGLMFDPEFTHDLAIDDKVGSHVPLARFPRLISLGLASLVRSRGGGATRFPRRLALVALRCLVEDSDQWWEEGEDLDGVVHGARHWLWRRFRRFKRPCLPLD